MYVVPKKHFYSKLTNSSETECFRITGNSRKKVFTLLIVDVDQEQNDCMEVPQSV